MISLTGMKTLASNSLGRTGLLLSRKSPEILLGVGITGVIVGTVLACKATLKAEKVIKETKEVLEKIEMVRKNTNDPEVYSEEDFKRDTALVYVKTSVELGKLYLPAVAVTGISFALIIGSHNILSKRNAAIAAAYRLIDASFKKYRERVKAEYGDEADRKLRFGEKEIEVIETNAKGKEVKKVKKVLDLNGDLNPYSFIFSEETATQYKRNYDMNLSLLKTVERYANDRLNARGHIFLSEVLDDLGLQRTPISIPTGWVKGYNPNNPNNDKYVDFGLDDPINEEKQDAHDRMLQPWVLNFNVDGNIYDLI